MSSVDDSDRSSSDSEEASTSGRGAALRDKDTDTQASVDALLAQIRSEVARRRNFAIISHPVSVCPCP
jgi:hypothetical protein